MVAVMRQTIEICETARKKWMNWMNVLMTEWSKESEMRMIKESRNIPPTPLPTSATCPFLVACYEGEWGDMEIRKEDREETSLNVKRKALLLSSRSKDFSPTPLCCWRRWQLLSIALLIHALHKHTQESARVSLNSTGFHKSNLA